MRARREDYRRHPFLPARRPESAGELDLFEIPLANRKTTPDAICVIIGEEVRRLLRKHRKKREQLLAVVVGVPAITNVDEGIVLSISTLENWRSVPLRTKLSKIVDCLVIIENDTTSPRRASAIAAPRKRRKASS